MENATQRDNQATSTQFRYRSCLNNPHWRRFFAGIIAVAARHGFTGVHIDCAGQHYCGCERCEQGFRAHLTRKYAAAELKARFGFKSPDDVKQPPLKRAFANPTLLDVERERYQIGSVTTGFWDAVRQGGESVLGAGKFWIHASSEEGREYYAGHNNSIMFEETDRFVGMIEREVLPRYYHNKYGSLIFEYKSDQAYAVLPLGQRPRMAGGILAKNRAFGEYSIRLGLAEGAAFSSGGGGFATLTSGYVFDVMRRFVEQNADLYDGYFGRGAVGLYQNYENRIILYNHEEHIAANTRVADEFLRRQVPFDFVVRAAAPEFLARYKVIAALDMPQLEEKELTELAGYVEAGGALIVDDRFALQDEFMDRRNALPWGDCLGKSGYDVRFGAGRVVALKAPESGEQVIETVTMLLGNLPVLADGPPGLRTNILERKRDGRCDVAVHLLNYNVPLVDATTGNGRYLKEPCQPRAIGPVTLNVPVANGWRARSVVLKSPDFEIAPKCSWERRDGAVRVEVAKVFIYSVAWLSLERE